jgi:hypothetical protein
MNHFILEVIFLLYLFYIGICFMCPHFLILTFVWSWFGPLFVDNVTLFVALKGKKQCWWFNFLFQNGVNVVAYLTMDNHKSFNTTRIWHYLSNLDCLGILGFFSLIVDFAFQNSSRNQYNCFDNLVATIFNLYLNFLIIIFLLELKFWNFCPSHMLCNLYFLTIKINFPFVIGMVNVIYVNWISLNCPPNVFLFLKKKLVMVSSKFNL